MLPTESKSTGIKLLEIGFERLTDKARSDVVLAGQEIRQTRSQDLICSEAKKAVAEVLIGPLFSAKVFSATTQAEKSAIMRTWISALKGYYPSEIAEAFKKFHRSGGTFPQPGDICKICAGVADERNSKILDKVRGAKFQQAKPDAKEGRVSAATANEILRQAGLAKRINKK